MAKIIIERNKVIAHRESKTFETRARAAAWMKAREVELAKVGEIERANKPVPTLADAIDKYLIEARKEPGRTKRQVLNTFKDYPIAGMACDQIESDHIVSFATELGKKVTPATVKNYLSHLAAIYAVARPAWRYPLDRAVMDDAWVVTKRLGLVGRGKERQRRPTMGELDLLMTHFMGRSIHWKQSSAMHKIIAFAIFSTRRLEEITLLRWSDFDQDRILVRDMKHPDDKEGNHVWVELLPEAVKIIESMPKVDLHIFPYNTRSLSSSMTRTCAYLKIIDLHFHDLRHDGISRLFEMGRTIPQVASVSGHRSWQSLKRYTHIRQSGDKYAGWKWLDIITRDPVERPKIRDRYAALVEAAE